MRVTVMTHLGRVREGNEDSLVVCGRHNELVCAQREFQKSWLTTPPLLACVADGMGGHRGGAVASRLVCETIEAKAKLFTISDSNLNLDGVIHDTVRAANQAIIATQDKQPSLHGMGSTLAGIYMTETQVTCFHTGDSRIYGLKNGYLQHLTTDHNQFESMNMHGVKADPEAKALTHCLGGGVLDNFVEITHLPRDPGITDFMICSDGVSEFCDEDTIELALREHAPARMNETIFSNGAADNFSYIIINIEGSP